MSLYRPFSIAYLSLLVPHPLTKQKQKSVMSGGGQQEEKAGVLSVHDAWYTCRHLGEVSTFRVLQDSETHTAVDAVDYLDELTQNVADLVEQGRIRTAAEAAYRSVPVEISLLDDPMAIPEEVDMDAAVDLWRPLHLAVTVQHQGFLDSLIHFHQDNAVAIMEELTRETMPDVVSSASSPCHSAEASDADDEEVGTGEGEKLSADGPRVRLSPNPPPSSEGSPRLASPDPHDRTLVMPAEHSSTSPLTEAPSGGAAMAAAAAGERDDAAQPASQQTPKPQPAPPSHGTPAREGRKKPKTGAARTTAPRPLLRCQVRADLAGAVVLLGSYENPTPALSSSVGSAPWLTQGNPRISPMRATSVRGGATTTSVHRDPSSTNGSFCGNAASGMTFTQSTGPTEAELAVAQRNAQLTEAEEVFLADNGETFCIANVMSALKPLVESVAYDVKREKKQPVQPFARKEGTAEAAQTSPSPPASPSFASAFVESFTVPITDGMRRPSLVIDAAVMYDLCQSDLHVLTDVLDRFQGTLTPIFRGKSFPNDHGGGSLPGTTTSASAAAAMNHAATASGGSTAPSPMLPALPLTATSIPTLPRSSLSASVGGGGGGTGSAVPSAHSTPRAPSLSRHGSTPLLEAFWWSCAPQDAQRVAFYVTWVNLRDQVLDKPGVGRSRRAASLLKEFRMALASFKRIREANYVPSGVIWSAHICIIAKLLSRDCTVEDFIDLIGEGSFLSWVTTQGGMPGVFVASLVAGAVAASDVLDANALRLLTVKMDTLLTDVPGRSTGIKGYLLSRPATHTERFEELWMGMTPVSEPKKFKTRAELLFFAVVEIVLLAAEKAWKNEPSASSSAVRQYSDAQQALQYWLSQWRGFLRALSEKSASGPTHRRSMSRGATGASASNSSLQGALSSHSTQPQPIPPPGILITPPTDSSTHNNNNNNSSNTSTTATPTPGLPKDVVQVQDEATEVAETLKRLTTVLPLRLQNGKPPLPALAELLYPSGADSDSLAGSLGPSGSGYHATGQVHSSSDRPLPVPSLDSEFAYIQQQFANNAAKESNEVKLKFYGLFKQATEGDVGAAKPWMFDTVGRAKWDAWSRCKGMSKVDAKRMYVSEYKAMLQLREDADAK